MSPTHPFEEQFNEAVEAFCQQCADDCLLCPHVQTLQRLQSSSPQEDHTIEAYSQAAIVSEPSSNPSTSLVVDIDLQSPPASSSTESNANQLDFTADSKPRGRGRPKKEVDPSIHKRKPGGQPGNLNAIRHGLYIQGNGIYNTTPMERAKLCDLNGAINHLKDFMDKTYENGKKLKSTVEINDTMKILSCTGMALTRMITVQQLTTVAWLPSALKKSGKDTPLKKIEDYYQNKIQYIDLDSTPMLDGISAGGTEASSDPIPTTPKEE